MTLYDTILLSTIISIVLTAACTNAHGFVNSLLFKAVPLFCALGLVYILAGKI